MRRIILPLVVDIDYTATTARPDASRLFELGGWRTVSLCTFMRDANHQVLPVDPNGKAVAVTVFNAGANRPNIPVNNLYFQHCRFNSINRAPPGTTFLAITEIDAPDGAAELVIDIEELP